jgi:hypothetical protein
MVRCQPIHRHLTGSPRGKAGFGARIEARICAVAASSSALSTSISATPVSLCATAYSFGKPPRPSVFSRIAPFAVACPDQMTPSERHWALLTADVNKRTIGHFCRKYLPFLLFFTLINENPSHSLIFDCLVLQTTFERPPHKRH